MLITFAEPILYVLLYLQFDEELDTTPSLYFGEKNSEDLLLNFSF